MKNKLILKLNRLAMIIPAVLVLLSLSSCQQEEPYSNRTSPGSTLVNLSVSASNSDVTLVSDDPASAIKSLCILQFNANGNDFGTLRHVGIGTENAAGGGKYSATLLQSNGNERYKLVVLANLPISSYSTLQGMVKNESTTYESVQSVLLSEISDSKPVFDNTTPFPMFGVIQNGDPLLINASQNFSGTTSLVRAVARVDIGIGKKDANTDTWTKNGVNFVMKEILFYGLSRRYAYMPKIDAFTSSGGELTINSPSPSSNGGSVRGMSYTGTDITAGTYCAEKIYVPEVFMAWGDVYDANHDKRSAIIVKGRYDTSNKDTYYRVDFTNDQTHEKMDILRNHVYQFTITHIADDGYDTAEEAYAAKPQGLSYTTSIDPWQTGLENAKPLPQEGFLMSYGAQNGSVTSGDGITIIKKSTGWTGENADPLLTVDYNIFYGEIPGNLKRSTAYPNGDIYPDLPTLTAVEGVYPTLMVATDDIYDAGGSPSVHWKDGMVLTAFDLCRSYSGLGYSDWRLPRASELALMYLNRASLEKQRGFTAFSGTYWSGSEKGNPTDAVAAQAWAVDFNAASAYHFGGVNKTSSACKIRCVRQVSNQKK